LKLLKPQSRTRTKDDYDYELTFEDEFDKVNDEGSWEGELMAALWLIQGSGGCPGLYYPNLGIPEEAPYDETLPFSTKS
jgi:hypothetical protein